MQFIIGYNCLCSRRYSYVDIGLVDEHFDNPFVGHGSIPMSCCFGVLFVNYFEFRNSKYLAKNRSWKVSNRGLQWLKGHACQLNQCNSCDYYLNVNSNKTFQICFFSPSDVSLHQVMFISL